MSDIPNIFMVGPMGAGKTTIGKRVANALDLEFLDLDEAVEERTGASISLIFDIEGEEGFRRREADMLERLAEGDGVLIATGGGAVLAPENRQRLRRSGLVVYLDTPIERQLERLSRDRHRPLLQSDDRRACLERLRAERDPLYREVADLVVESDGRKVGAMARIVVQRIRELLDAQAPTRSPGGHAAN